MASTELAVTALDTMDGAVLSDQVHVPATVPQKGEVLSMTLVSLLGSTSSSCFNGKSV